MKWYLGNVPVFKLGSIFYWKGKKYQVISNKSCKEGGRPAAIGVKVVCSNLSNS